MHAHVAPDVFGLWERWEKECGGECPIPYWSVVWPGAVVLAGYFLSNQATVAGKSVLDLGCGGGLAGLAAARAGACRVVSNDEDPVALHVASLNARMNSLPFNPSLQDMISSGADPDFDIVIAADLFYERSRADATLRFLQSARRGGATVYIADGERAFAPREGVEEFVRRRVPVNEELEGTPHRTVRLLLLDSAGTRSEAR